METRTDISAYIDDLKRILTDLRDTGDDGFEGLIGTVLSEIAGVPFRLAGSGLQFGVDGKSTYADDGLSFECKRYVGDIRNESVTSKIGDLFVKGSDIDLWVLCATSQIKSQPADKVHRFGEESATSTLILDWSTTGLPPLAVALAMASAKVQDFLRNHIEAPESLAKAKDALTAVKNDPAFNGHAEKIRAILRDPTLGMTAARQTNAKWLADTFSSRQLARERFGQPLSPSDEANGAVLPRDNLVAELHPFLTGEPIREILCVIGGEGNGKSWLVAQGWLSVEEKPLMVILNPNAFDDTVEQNDVQELLISALIEQTGDHASGTIKDKWGRILDRWRNHPAERLRLVVFIDGINQRPEKDWARIAEKLASELDQIGGQLIVTVRTQYYRNRVQRRLFRACKEVEIPEWTEQERDRILAGREIIATNLQPKVAASLLNPRLLGIALELLEGDDLAGLEEVSVNHLLFEHIRANEQDAPVQQSANEFVLRLRNHANEVISRISSSHGDDPTVFDYDLQAVAEGRFYRTIEGYPSRYKLDEDGLILALGFAVIDRLYSASRSDSGLDEAVEEIIEPIAELDRTANVVLAALTVTCLDSGDPKIAATLIRVFADLQNPDVNDFNPFARLARICPSPFTEAAHSLCLSGGHQNNFDWIREALMLAREDENAWQIIFKEVQTWLSYYSLAPERGLFPATFSSSSEEKEEQYKEKERKIREALESLSEAENKILAGLTKVDGDLNTLSRLAFFLFAGKPIKPAAQALVQWSFANALNTDLMFPDREFKHLVRFNRVDWSDARVALLAEADVLRQEEISVTGKWALVNILRATGNTEDAKKARILVEELTKDHTYFPGWRSVENYCSTDPCDPASEKPDNVKQTAQNYRNIDVKKIRLSRSTTSEDHFFAMARPGMARFEAQVAIAKHREFAQDIVRRQGWLLYLGLFEFLDHNALLTRETGLKLLRSCLKTSGGLRTAANAAIRFFRQLLRWEKSGGTNENDLSEQDRWSISQYRLLLAFPSLSSREQIDALLSSSSECSILADLMEVAKPLEEKVFDSLLKSACQNGDEHAQFVLLGFARETSTPISIDARKHIARLANAKSEQVRVQALGIIAQLEDVGLLTEVIHGDWRVSESKDYEAFYGSAILVQAATYGIIEHSDALDRMSSDFYGRAAEIWSEQGMRDAVRDVALHVHASICRVTNLEVGIAAPDIEMRIGYEERSDSLLSISDRPAGLAEQWDRFAESDEEFIERQNRNQETYRAFRDRLTAPKARIILDHFGYDGLGNFCSIVESNEDLADQWYEMFIGLDKARLPVVHNLVLLLAHALGKRCPEKAANLFRLVREGHPLIRLTFGRAAVSLDAMAVWGGPDTAILNDLRFKRLDRATNDYELSQEVLVAHLNDKQNLLRQYIGTKLEREEPVEIARAIMVAGFSDNSEFNDDVLDRYQDTDYFIGDAHNAARYAYDRNTWARHWFAQMCEADEADEFWRFSILFAKIVDGRYEFWRSEYKDRNEPMKLFWPSVRSRLRNRFKKWENLRDKKLFGGDAPSRFFLF